MWEAFVTLIQSLVNCVIPSTGGVMIKALTRSNSDKNRIKSLLKIVKRLNNK